LGKTTSSLGTLLVRLELIATINHVTIFKTHVFRLYSHLCIYIATNLQLRDTLRVLRGCLGPNN
jgi:hypothetical protein